MSEKLLDRMRRIIRLKHYSLRSMTTHRFCLLRQKNQHVKRLAADLNLR